MKKINERERKVVVINPICYLEFYLADSCTVNICEEKEEYMMTNEKYVWIDTDEEIDSADENRARIMQYCKENNIEVIAVIEPIEC